MTPPAVERRSIVSSLTPNHHCDSGCITEQTLCLSEEPGLFFLTVNFNYRPRSLVNSIMFALLKQSLCIKIISPKLRGLRLLIIAVRKKSFQFYALNSPTLKIRGTCIVPSLQRTASFDRILGTVVSPSKRTDMQLYLPISASPQTKARRPISKKFNRQAAT